MGGIWALLGAVLKQVGLGNGFGQFWADFGQRWKGQDGAKMGPKSAKMGHVGAKLAAFFGQEAPRSIQEGLVGAMLGALQSIWGAFGEHFDEKA